MSVRYRQQKFGRGDDPRRSNPPMSIAVPGRKRNKQFPWWVKLDIHGPSGSNRWHIVSGYGVWGKTGFMSSEDALEHIKLHPDMVVDMDGNELYDDRGWYIPPMKDPLGRSGSRQRGNPCEDNPRHRSPRLTVKKVDGEWQVVWYGPDGRRDEGKTYYAADEEDARNSAKFMQREMDRAYPRRRNPRVTLRRGAKGDRVYDDPTDDRARRRAYALADLHHAGVDREGDDYVVDAQEWYTPSAQRLKKETEHVTDAYTEAALWSTKDESDESGGEPLDANYSWADIDDTTWSEMKRDCAKFLKENFHDINQGESWFAKAGHDFWLTRNGHGAGFWDGDWPEPAATRLTRAAEKFGEYNLYVGDDGKIYGTSG